MKAWTLAKMPIESCVTVMFHDQWFVVLETPAVLYTPDVSQIGME